MKLPTAFFVSRICELLQRHDKPMKEQNILENPHHFTSLQSPTKKIQNHGKSAGNEVAMKGTECLESDDLCVQESCMEDDESMPSSETLLEDGKQDSTTGKDGLLHAFKQRRSSSPHTQGNQGQHEVNLAMQHSLVYYLWE